MTEDTDRISKPSSQTRQPRLLIGVVIGFIVILSGLTIVLQHFASTTDQPVFPAAVEEDTDVAALSHPFGEGIYTPRRSPLRLERPDPTTKPVGDEVSDEVIVYAKPGDPDFDVLIGTWIFDPEASAKEINRAIFEDAAADPEAMTELMQTTIDSLKNVRVEVEFRRDGSFSRSQSGLGSLGDERHSGTFRVFGNIVETSITHRDGQELDQPESGFFNRAGDRVIVPDQDEPAALLAKKL